MSYTNTVTLTSLEGGAWPPVTARLWMLVTLPPPLGTDQIERGTDSVTASNSFTFSFALGPSFSGAGIGVSLQDTPRVANDSGWWFRSGEFSGALPTERIDVVLLAPVGLTRADFAAALPALPIAMSSSRTITFLSVISGSFLVVTAAGTTTEALGVSVAFTCRIEFELAASSSISAPGQLFKFGSVSSVIVDFSGTNPAATAAAAILDVEPGLKQQYQDFVTNTILPFFASGLGPRLVTAVLSTSLAGLIGPGVSALPTGVILSVRSIEVTTPGLTVRAALGAFGGVLSKFPPPPSTGRCFIAAAATSESSPDVRALRDFRDSYLLSSRTGGHLVRLYEAISPSLAKRIRANRLLRVAIRYLIVRPAASVARLVKRF
jgi:hypothetical protein